MSRQSRSPTDCCQLSNILAPPLFAITDQSLTILERCPPPKPPATRFFPRRSGKVSSSFVEAIPDGHKGTEECLPWVKLGLVCLIPNQKHCFKVEQSCDMSIACAAYLMPSGDGASSPIALQEVSSLCNLRRVISITAACSHAPPR